MIRNIMQEYLGYTKASYSLDEFKENLYELIFRKGLYDDFYSLIIRDNLYLIASQIFDRVAELWKPPYYVPFKVAALDKILGLSILEMQGRYSNDKLVWFKIYGAKGSEEKDKVAKSTD